MSGTHERKFFDSAVTVSALVGDEDNGIAVRILKLVAVVTAVCLVLSAVLIGTFLSEGSKNAELLSSFTQIFERSSNGSTKDVVKELKAVNPDSVGWLYVPNSRINLPVLQGSDDRFYINHNYIGEKSRYGAVFLSSGDKLSPKDADKNLVIYGNNMSDGQMFGTLKKYRNVNYYKKNAGFYFYNEYARDTYAICAVMVLDSAGDKDFDVTKSHFADSVEFYDWYKGVQSRSLINTGMNAYYGDKFITLVSPTDDFEGARLAVLARCIPNMDTNSINTTDAVANGDVRYPEKWYKARGIEPTKKTDNDRKEEQNASEPES